MASMYRFQRRFNSLVSDIDEDQFNQGAFCLTGSFIFEIMLALSTHSILRRWGDSPLRLLRAIVKVNLYDFLSAFMCCSLFFLMMQHSHWGLDPTFRFAWVGDGKKEWLHGLTWG